VAALAVIGFFGYQASAGDGTPLADPPSPSGEATPGDGNGGGRGGASGDGGEQGDDGRGTAADVPAVPAGSGTGRRVVYSVDQGRVWLVDVSEDGAGEVVAETYEVHRSAVDPPPGEYAVTSRWDELTGSDGVPVEHVVVFHSASDGTVFGFSAALDGSVPDPENGPRTGGIRQSREDGAAMWAFADSGTTVVVVP
jgi:hypothetical protein